MTTITVYYEAEKDGETGEAALDIEMTDELAENLTEHYGKAGAFLAAECYMTSMVNLAEKLRGRRYIPGSIKTVKRKGKR